MPHRILTDIKLPDFRDRPRKQGDILRTAEALFMQYGYNKVTVEEICREASVSKVTFYKYFPNKFAVLEDYMTSRLELGMETFRRIMDSEAVLRDQLRAIIAMKASAISKFSTAFLNSFMNDDPAMNQLMAKWQQMTEESMRLFFVKAQANGEIHPQYNVDFLMHVWQVMALDSRSEEVLKIYGDDYMKLTNDIMNFLVYGTTGPPREELA